jgi:dihydroorotase
MPAEAPYDLLLSGGHVVDPANKVDGIVDVAVRDNKIAAVGSDLPGSATHTVDCSGLWIVPGLLDIHVHTYTTRDSKIGGFGGSIDGDAHFLKEGVTTCVDTGTAGSEEIEHFRKTVIDRSKIRMYAYVNISAPGMGDAEQTVSNLDPKKAAAAAAQHSEVVVGIKTAHYWTKHPFDAQHPPWASVDLSVEAGDLCNLPVMVDFWPRPPERPYDDLILKHLRAGDIHTHVFARQFPIIDDEGKVYDHMFAARERGIHFDVGHGAASFWYRNGMPAITQGFPPDSISTDLHMGNIHGHVHSMLDTMGKCMAMGMDFNEVIYRSTVTPAKAIGHTELGTLSAGAEADIAVLRRTPGTYSLRDCGWGRIVAKERLECEMTVRNGQILWDRLGLSCPDWEDGGPDYFNLPGTQARGVVRLWRN